MISILIVEDTPYKAETLKRLIIDDLLLESDSFTIAPNVKAAKRLLVSMKYDLLILDLVLPLEPHDEPRPENSISFLKDIQANPTIKSPIHIIGLTQFGDLQVTYGEEFREYLWHLINYNYGETNWRTQLKNLIFHLISTKQEFQQSAGVHSLYDVAVITALNKPEFERILEWPIKWSQMSLANDHTIYYTGEIENCGRKSKIIAACVEQMGMTATAVLSSKMIHAFRPKVFIMGGICAGIRERDLEYGDIIIADQTWDYGSGKIREIDNPTNGLKDHVFEPELRPIELSPFLRAKVNAFLRRNDILPQIQVSCNYNKPKIMLKALMGPVASGSYVISSVSKLNEIRTVQRKLLGVEMEGYGLYYACAQNQDYSVKGIMIKSVSDYGDSSKNDSFQEYSSFTSAQFIYYFIKDELT